MCSPSSSNLAQRKSMKCPHCSIAFHEIWLWGNISFEPVVPSQIPPRLPSREDSLPITDHQWGWRATVCPDCREPIIKLGNNNLQLDDWYLAYPRFPVRAPIDDAVPESFWEDYMEACNVLPISPKASAALSRRVLQAILNDRGYSSENLAKQIDSALNESDLSRVLPDGVRRLVDAVRNIGNFAAHQITDRTTLRVIDVEPEEAEWCLEIVEALFEHYYALPAQSEKRLARLKINLKKAGKPPIKS